MQPPNQQARCGSCGAPDDGELVLCRYCKNAISPALLQSAIPCPQCRQPNRWGRQKCAPCSAWLVVACVFCGALSPHNQSACLACQQPFAGAMQRKQAMQQQQQHQQNMQTAGVVGNIAASFLGAAAGSAVTHSWYSNDVPHHHHSWGGTQESWDNSYDNSSSYDNSDAGSDWGGGDSGGGDSGGGDW
jgi:hypothetical protein